MFSNLGIFLGYWLENVVYFIEISFFAFLFLYCIIYICNFFDILKISQYYMDNTIPDKNCNIIAMFSKYHQYL